ncbi:hypothetical protein HZ326_22802 [Fusarium oxysporum f. sp. albedinis]|nr:hypothetical protein HZ326_22802 [Fusarium oxysporum f. sp. albedinis]
MAWKVSPFNAREYHIRKLFKGKSQSQACNIAFYNLTRQPPTINCYHTAPYLLVLLSPVPDRTSPEIEHTDPASTT